MNITDTNNGRIIHLDRAEFLMLFDIINAIPEQVEKIQWDYSGNTELEAKDVDKFIEKFMVAVRENNQRREDARPSML